jgi:hypothetical protein
MSDYCKNVCAVSSAQILPPVHLAALITVSFCVFDTFVMGRHRARSALNRKKSKKDADDDATRKEEKFAQALAAVNNGVSPYTAALKAGISYQALNYRLKVLRQDPEHDFRSQGTVLDDATIVR